MKDENTDGNMFEKLVSDLNSSERKNLLDKLKNLKEISSEPLKQESERQEVINYNTEYKRLSVLQKFLILLQQLFTGKDPIKLVENIIVKRYIEKIQKQTVSIVNFSTKKFLDGFCKELITLNTHLTKIKEPFQIALEANRKEFFAFFVSLQLEDFQEKLNEEIDPYRLYEASRLAEATEIKDEMSKRFQAVLSGISDTDKTRMNHHAFSLHYLYKLCSFNFDLLISRFSESFRGESGSLPFQDALKEISRLLDLLQSAGYPPAADAIEAVILFQHHEHMQDPDIDIDDTIKNSISRVETAFSAIRKFNKNVPLLNIIRALTRNLNYIPKIIKGGDDWFVLFKNYWEEKIGQMYKSFYSETRKTSFLTNTNEFLKLDKFNFLQHYNDERIDNHPVYKYPHCLGFIAGFHERLYVKSINKSLNILLLQGSFYKQENRTEFTDAYNFLNGVHNSILQLDNSLSGSGDLGVRLEKVQTEIMKGNLNSSHLEVIIKEADKSARGIIDSTIKALNSIELILNGVLFSKGGDKYDTISNLKRIGGKSNPDYHTAWKIALNLIHKANEFLRDIINLEGRQA